MSYELVCFDKYFLVNKISDFWSIAVYVTMTGHGTKEREEDR